MTKIVKREANLFDNIRTLLVSAKQSVLRQVNTTITTTYFEIGRMIVEDEQKGEIKAKYGKKVLRELSNKLTAEFGKGFSTDNLEHMRNFYLTYSISQTLSDQSEKI